MKLLMTLLLQKNQEWIDFRPSKGSEVSAPSPEYSNTAFTAVSSSPQDLLRTESAGLILPSGSLPVSLTPV